MSLIRRYVDPGLLAALAIGLLASWPLLTRPSLPTMTDAEMHIYRAAEIQSAIQQGNLYPRWASDFYFGYGYPVFNFYSPLSYHLAADYSLLTQTDVVAGTKFVLVLAFCLGAVGMYLFGHDRWGPLAGLVASAAFAFSPYILYIDPHARGDVPETFAVGLAPLMLWTFDRLRRTGSPRHLAFSGLSLAALILSHPLMALVVYSFLLAFLAWETLISPLVPQTYLGPEPRRYIPQLALALGLGLALAAFYWLPAGLERSAVQLHNVAGPGYFDFHNYFTSLRELLSPSHYFDLGATEPSFNHNLGLPQWLLAVAGALTIFSARLRRLDTIFFAFAALAFVYVITQASVNFWEAVPLMSFFQFPTRFLGPAALAFAPLAGNAVRWLDRFDDKRLPVIASSLSIGFIILAAMPLLYPPQWSEFGAVTPLRMIGVELQGRALGTTSANDFLPVGVSVVPGAEPVILNSYQAGDVLINRVNRATLPAGAKVSPQVFSHYYTRYEVSSPEAFVFRLFLFYFPGWQARVDGQLVPIEVAQPDGFITFNVPAGTHTVEVDFADTWPRRLGWGLAFVALIGLLGAIWLAVTGGSEQSDAAPLDWRPALGLAAVLVLAVGLKLTADRSGWFRYESTGNTVEVAQYEHYVKLDRGFQLLAYDVHSSAIRPGDPLTVTLYWKTQAPQPHNFQVYVHLLDAGGQLVAQSDKLNPADFPTSRWPADRYIRDEHALKFNADPPPGEYKLVVGLWNAGTGERLQPVTPTEVFAEGIVLPTRITIQP
ncbi:MAG: glycosyltransferase family 39 protein [Chloroflexi bacterium]|nr:glycosyltransferase family 39 protein [Chloroflexota bacterium]